MYWHQGWDNAPDLVRRCAGTWRDHNPSWRIHMLDETTLSGAITMPPIVASLRPALPHLSDIIRVCLLRKYGGVWADATLWCMRPLDSWIDSVTSPANFFAYDRPGLDRPISNWFLSASENSLIVNALHRGLMHLYKKTVAYIRNTGRPPFLRPLFVRYHATRYRYGNLLVPTALQPDIGPYFAFHYLYRMLLDKNRRFYETWGGAPKISADGPHLLQNVGLLSPATPQITDAIETCSSNMFKLTHKIDLPSDISGTVLDTLYSSCPRAENNQR